MYRTASLLLFLLFYSHQISAQGSWKTALPEVETARFRAMTQKDTLQLRTLLADELVYIHSNGLVETRADHLRSIAGGKIEYRSMNRDTVAVRRHGKIGLTNGIVRVQGALEGKPFELRLRYTAVYRYQKKRWQLLNWQSTKM